jgi:hypothetical protein
MHWSELPWGLECSSVKPGMTKAVMCKTPEVKKAVICKTWTEKRLKDFGFRILKIRGFSIPDFKDSAVLDSEFKDSGLFRASLICRTRTEKSRNL